MDRTTSADGTTIAYEKDGDGPAIVFVTGAFNDHHRLAPLAAALRDDFTVVVYDRRGRGESGDGPSYAIEREIEDLAAVIEAAGGSAYVYGTSSGAALALRAAAAGVPITKLAVFEAPFVVDGSRKPIPSTWVADLRGLADQPGSAIKYFMTRGIGLPGFVVSLMKLMPAWKGMKAVAHTIWYDAEVVGRNAFGQPLDASQWAGIEVPALVVGGGKSPRWMRTSVRAVADAVPGASYREIAGQNHMIKAAAIAPVLTEHFGG